MPRRDDLELLTTREALSLLTVDELKALASLVGQVAMKKGDLVDLLARAMADREEVRTLYAGLDDMGQKAVQEATHDPAGVLDGQRFWAKYGRSPHFGGSGRRYDDERQPTALRLFFMRDKVLPADLREILLTFVPEPPPLTVQAGDELPALVKRPHVYLGSYHRKPDEEEVELRVRQTARAALHDLNSFLPRQKPLPFRLGFHARQLRVRADRASVLANGP